MRTMGAGFHLELLRPPQDYGHEQLLRDCSWMACGMELPTQLQRLISIQIAAAASSFPTVPYHPLVRDQVLL